MRYAHATAFRTALEHRLATRSRQTGVALVRLRKTVVFDRLLARLLAAAPDRWILKGALALDFRFCGASRTTMDVDLGRADDESGAAADLIASQTVAIGDQFAFAIERTARLDQLQGAAAVRYHAVCDARRLRLALEAVFEGRGTHALPVELPQPPRAWSLPYRRLAAQVGLEPDLAHAHRSAAALMDPVLRHDVFDGAWDAHQRVWLR